MKPLKMPSFSNAETTRRILPLDGEALKTLDERAAAAGVSRSVYLSRRFDNGLKVEGRVKVFPNEVGESISRAAFIAYVDISGFYYEILSDVRKELKICDDETAIETIATSDGLPILA